MPSDSFFDNEVTDGSTIDDYLVGIAEGVAEAQRRIDAMTAAGGSVSYQIPRLDFELKMTMNITEKGAAPGAARAPLMKRLRLRSARDSEATMSSTITGSFVAVPANGGRPQNLIEVTIASPEKRNGVTILGIEIYTGNNAGEPIAGAEVQVNIDRELSSQLDGENGIAKHASAACHIAEAVIVSDAAGLAHAELAIPAREPKGSSIAIVIDSLQLSRSVIYRIS